MSPDPNQPDQTDQPAPNPLVTVQLSEDDRKKWRKDIDQANKRRQVFEPAWQRNLNAYTPDPTNEKWGDEVNPGIDFYQTEQKKDQLFFDTPQVILAPEPDTPPNPAITDHQAKLNRRLGRTGLDCKRLMDNVLVDIICPAGMGCIKVGVTRVTKDVPLPVPQGIPGEPAAGPAPAQAVSPGSAPPQTVPVPVYQKIFAERFSPKKKLSPVNFHDTEFDKAPWQGMKFTMPKRSAIRQFGLVPEADGTIPGLKSTKSDEQVFEVAGVPKDDQDSDEVSGEEIWYVAALYDDNVYHPDHLRQLVFLDGIDDPVVHRDSPYQTFVNGELQPDDPATMIGFPIHTITVRDLPDSSYVPSDCTITRPLVNEIAKFRTQLIEMRDSATSIRIADENVITPEVMGKIIRGPFGAILPVANFDPGRPPIMEIAHPVYSRENFTAQDKIEQDLTKVNTLASNQTGTEQDTVRSATELTYVQQNANVRLQAEKNRVVAGFLGMVQKIDALVKRFETPPGQQPISGYTYDIKPDSGQHVDAATKRKFAMDRYNFFAKAPNVNQQYLLQETALLTDLDPSKLFVQPPPPKPEPPKISFIVKGDDLNPLSPQYPNMLQALAEAGVTLQTTEITPQLVQNAALSQPLKHPEHGGTAPEADTVSKHAADGQGHPSIPNFGGQAGRVQ